MNCQYLRVALLTIRRLICETDSSANKEEILKKWL